MPGPKHLRNLHAALYLLLKMQQKQKNKQGHSKQKSNLDKIIEEFNDYLLNVCDLAESTRLRNLKNVRVFLNNFFSNSSMRIADLTPFKVRKCLCNNFKQYKHNGFRVFMSSIHKFFTFLQFKGIGNPLLIQSLPKIVGWKSENLPNWLNTQEVRLVLAACNKSTAVGKRDYAIITFMLELGLRASEVADLTLNSINWHSQIVHILCRKTRKSYELPMTPLIIDALIDYLKNGRPKTTSPKIVFNPAAATSLAFFAILMLLYGHKINHVLMKRYLYCTVFS
jgi:site-specific recombinase XerD